MGYKADGSWDYEDSSVSTRLTGLLNQDSPLMQQAKTTGLQQANKRGLLNSSMAIGAAQAESLRAALPIASQDASQIGASNLSAQGFAQQRALTGATSAELQERQLSSAERIAAQGESAQTARQTAGLSSTERITAADLDTRNRIANLNVASHDREIAMSAARAAENIYSDAIVRIQTQTDLPAAARDQYLTHFGALRDQWLNMVEAIYSVDLDWTSAVTPPAA
ncbi:MAG: hypothetical protein Q7S17_07795 [Xanthobacteraceae bacterium]|nr:hypothetical protein [Xanthobacteraceae bacterium]